MVLTYIFNINTSQKLLKSAFRLSTQLGKTFGIVYYTNSNDEIDKVSEFISKYLENLNIKTDFITVITKKLTDFEEICEVNDVSFLFCQLYTSRSKDIQQLLSGCRSLRIPYLLFKDEFTELTLEKVVLPVNFLEEEIEKAQFAAAFGRFCRSEITILLANDSGSKAKLNTERMLELFQKFEFKFQVEKAKKDSFSVNKESVIYARNISAGIIIITTSRDYGLDDLIFGPNELHIIKKSEIPILLVNPRGDLYALCD